MATRTSVASGTTGEPSPILASQDARISSTETNIIQLAGRIRHLEKMMDTRATPLWKRALFRLDGWPSWPYVASQPHWRPWRKWWRS